MNTTLDDGGPAFPVSDMYETVHGMSLRDWFAGMALQGLAGPTITDAARQRIKPDKVPAQLASGCYAIADAMLLERKEGK